MGVVSAKTVIGYVISAVLFVFAVIFALASAYAPKLNKFIINLNVG